MDIAARILAARTDLRQFDYDHYPACFAAFEADCRDYFGALELSGAEAAAAGVLRDLEERRAALPRREQKASLEQERQVLALFLSPAAARYGEAAAAFSRALREQWLGLHPRLPYQLGDFDAILRGFDANLLGLPLRKSKRRNP